MEFAAEYHDGVYPVARKRDLFWANRLRIKPFSAKGGMVSKDIWVERKKIVITIS
jgi:hypothetical protein